MEDFRKKRMNNYSHTGPGPIGRAPMYGSLSHNSHMAKPQYATMYQPHANTIMPHGRTDDMAVLAEGFSRMNLPSPSFTTQGKPSPQMSTQMSTQSSEYGGVNLGVGGQMSSQMSDIGGVPLNHGVRPAFMYNGFMFTPAISHATAPTQNGLPASPGMYAPPFLTQANFAGYPGSFVNPHSPLSQAWNSSRVPSSEVPTLITPRRDSTSSNENEAPGTPFTQYTGYGEYQLGVAVVDRSPHSAYNWATPSPPQNGFGMAKAQIPTNVSPRLQLLLQQMPAIPRAVPAPYSPMKPLDRSLENPNGVTNVYVRGLLPSTTDEMLYKLASRFGEIASSKSIIDHATGLCKGYGFVKFHSFSDAEDCIRGFHFMGYETSFARESFYSQLKKLSDETNTNLYVSNLPKDMNEHELGAIFGPHKVCSSRILRDQAGNGRGVGFARFESREVCDEVIKDFNNTPVAKRAGEEHLIQIRFADTQDQKSLKQQTTAARQYRTAEYESQTSGQYPDSVIGSVRGKNSENEFEHYLAKTAGGSISSLHSSHAAYVQFPGRERVHTVSAHLSPNLGPAVVTLSLPVTIKAEPTETRLVSVDEKLQVNGGAAVDIADAAA